MPRFRTLIRGIFRLMLSGLFILVMTTPRSALAQPPAGGTLERICTGFQFVERTPWLPGWGVNHFFGVDGDTDVGTGVKKKNYFLVYQDTYVFGKGIPISEEDFRNNLMLILEGKLKAEEYYRTVLDQVGR